MWIFIVALVIVLLMLGFANLILNLIFGKRCEGNAKLKYFTAKDFKGLNAEPIEFKSNKEQILRGNIYTNESVKEFKGVIVFVHGMGAGHLSYTTEINTLAKKGFAVVGYDNTGTCSSEGKKLNGFFQSVLDLDYALKFVEQNEKLNKLPLFLMGHSWGAYTVCQVLQFKHNIKGIVSISGVNNVSSLICDLMQSQTKINFNFLKPFFYFINLLKFGKRGIRNTLDVIKNADIPILLLHGESDETVPIKNSLVWNREIFAEKSNIKIIAYKDKYHNVYQTKESEKYLNDVFGNIAKLNKNYKGKELEEQSDLIYNNIDYKKITEEDEEVMNEITNFLFEALK